MREGSGDKKDDQFVKILLRILILSIPERRHILIEHSLEFATNKNLRQTIPLTAKDFLQKMHQRLSCVLPKVFFLEFMLPDVAAK